MGFRNKRTPVLQNIAEQERRAAILVCLRNGRAPAAIADFTGIPRATVYLVATAFQAAEDEEGSASSHRKVQDRSVCRKRSKDFINRLQALIDANPSRSMRNLAAELNVSRTTIVNDVHEDLRYHSYVPSARQMLSQSQRERRLAKCHLLLSSLKHEAAGRLRFFSDEKIFTVDQVANRRYDRWLA